MNFSKKNHELKKSNRNFVSKAKFTLIIALLITINAVAQQGINYKALIKDVSGNVLAETSISIQLNIQYEPQGFIIVYSEEHSVDTDINGIVIVNIGDGNQTSEDDPFSEIEWSDEEYYLNVQVDINGDTNYVDMGTTQFMAVPYAKHATTATTALNAGATSINGLTDGKSDNDGTNNGSSLFIGLDAGANDDGTNNQNVGIGYQALYENTTGNFNTANGSLALSTNTTGVKNTANGFGALRLNETGSYNTANGGSALNSNTTGDYNTANGSSALLLNTIGVDNTANGAEALRSNTEGINNVANGSQALYTNTYGSYNTANGYQALYKNTTGNYNTANGYKALHENTTGVYNTANGVYALYSNTTGIDNTANGFYALYYNETGVYNTANGVAALFYNDTGNYNTANGTASLYNNTTGSNNTANGFEALYKNTADNNTANGFEALHFNETGVDNTANGYQALYKNTAGGANTANGGQALYNHTTGNWNTANGYQALYNHTTGIENTAIGDLALYDNISGSGNVALGNEAGSSETGSNKLYIANSGTDTPLIYGEFDNKTLTINGATTVINSVDTNPDLILGGTRNTEYGDNGVIASNLNWDSSDIYIQSNDAVVILLDYDANENGEFQIYNGTGAEVFAVNESGTVTQFGTTLHLSDRRFKKDIEDLPYGLKEILQLQPKAYNWKNRETDHKSLGLIAQDVQLLIEEIVTAKDDEQKTLGISYTELIPVLIKAIQEQQEIINTQNINYTALLQRVVQLENATNSNNTEEVASSKK